MFEHYRDLAPSCFIACERTACVGPEDLRVTFDEDLRFRTDRLSLYEQTDGRPILKEGTVVMEVKYPGGAPMWLSEAFSRMGVFPQSMSKYGRAYTYFIAGGSDQNA